MSRETKQCQFGDLFQGRLRLNGGKRFRAAADDDGAPLRVYVCGPTVYSASHLGHARTYMVADSIRRTLRECFGFRVLYAVNITDIDDKIIQRAHDEKTTCTAIARKYEDDFWADMDALNVQRPDFAPRVSEHLPQIIQFVETLMQRGFAYSMSGGVYFDTVAFQSAGYTYPDAVHAQHKVVPTADAAHDEDKAAGKKHHADFALWKFAKPNEPSWEASFGRGRPGWHIECSAMAQATLGPVIDIHMGGVDLVFPHHSNELAQSQAFLGRRQWVREWLHTGHLNIAGQKMSKSLKNFTTIRQTLDKYTASQLRIFFLRKTAWFDSQDLTELGMLEAVEMDYFFRDSLLVLSTAFTDASSAASGVLQNANILQDAFTDALSTTVGVLQDANTTAVMLQKVQELPTIGVLQDANTSAVMQKAQELPTIGAIQDADVAAVLKKAQKSIANALCNRFDFGKVLSELHALLLQTRRYVRSGRTPLSPVVVGTVVSYANWLLCTLGIYKHTGETWDVFTDGECSKTEEKKPTNVAKTDKDDVTENKATQYDDKRMQEKGQTTQHDDKRMQEKGQTTQHDDKRTQEKGQTTQDDDKRTQEKGQMTQDDDRRTQQKSQPENKAKTQEKSRTENKAKQETSQTEVDKAADIEPFSATMRSQISAIVQLRHEVRNTANIRPLDSAALASLLTKCTIDAPLAHRGDPLPQLAVKLAASVQEISSAQMDAKQARVALLRTSDELRTRLGCMRVALEDDASGSSTWELRARPIIEDQRLQTELRRLRALVRASSRGI